MKDRVLKKHTIICNEWETLKENLIIPPYCHRSARKQIIPDHLFFSPANKIHFIPNLEEEINNVRNISSTFTS